MEVLAISGGLIFYPQYNTLEQDVFYLRNQFNCVYVASAGGMIPRVLVQYWEGYDENVDYSGDAFGTEKEYNYYFWGLENNQLAYNYIAKAVLPKLDGGAGFLEDGYHVLNSENGRFDDIAPIEQFKLQFLPTGYLPKNKPQHPNIVMGMKFVIEDYKKQIALLKKQVDFYEKLSGTDLTNLVNDLAVIKTALATPCVNGSPLDPNFIPTFTNSSSVDLQNFKTESDSYKENILVTGQDYYDKLIAKIKTE